MARERRLRVEVDGRPETLARRVRAAREELVPYIGVIGPREAQSGTVSVRNRDTGSQTEVALEELVEGLARERDLRRLKLALAATSPGDIPRPAEARR
jgi:threonyl-tRNA synthetase